MSDNNPTAMPCDQCHQPADSCRCGNALKVERLIMDGVRENISLRQQVKERDAEIERLQKGIKAAHHLLMAAVGPEYGPTSWVETRQRWNEEFADLEERKWPLRLESTRT